MSLITQCPACGTFFKVVADQLKISQGWVRCGQCRELFDAQTQMATDSAAAALEANANRAVNVPEVATNSLAAYALSAGAGPDFSDSDWVNSVHPPAPTSEVVTPATPTPTPPLALEATPVPAPAAAAAAAPEPDAMPAAERDAPPDTATPSFMRQAQRARRWQTPWVRAALGLVAVGLMTGLAAQVLRHERDRIATALPPTLPALQALCRATDCSVGPLKQIDAVVLDASSFNKLRGDGKHDLYKLSLSLKNSGTLAVALPHVELSLTDAQDQPLLRRVLNPAELGATQPALPPAAEFTGVTTIQIDNAQLAGARVAGYRLWAFYP